MKKPDISKAFNVWLLDVKRYLEDHACWEVTSTVITDPSSGNFHDNGLYSESIFGPINSERRMLQFGSINFNTEIIHPHIYVNLEKLGSRYIAILEGRQTAVFDPIKRDFVQETEENGGRTGFSFFMEYLDKLDFKDTGSKQRAVAVKAIADNRKLLKVGAFPVLPAGMRDAKIEDGRIVQEEINTFYSQIIAVSSSLQTVSALVTTMYDSVRVMLQKKVVDLYMFLMDVISGKYGFFQGQYGSRNIAQGTRNVVSGTPYVTQEADDPQMVKHDETQIGLYVAANGLLPAVAYELRTIFFDVIFGDGQSTSLSLTDPKTMTIAYDEFDFAEVDKFVGREATRDWLKRFSDPGFRFKPMTIRSTSGKVYGLMGVYDTGKTVALVRSKVDLLKMLPNADLSRFRLLTWAEAFYIATHKASIGRHVMNTRYPITGEGSAYPTRIHVATTNKARIVKLVDVLTSTSMMFPQYPAIGEVFFEGSLLTPGRLNPSGADYDGDMFSHDATWSEEANEDIRKFLESPNAYVNTERQLVTGAVSDTANLTLVNFTRGVEAIIARKKGGN